MMCAWFFSSNFLALIFIFCHEPIIVPFWYSGIFTKMSIAMNVYREIKSRAKTKVMTACISTFDKLSQLFISIR